MTDVLHGLSFDLEDWQQNLRRRLGRESEPSPGLGRQLASVLDLCDEFGIKATFFVVGRLARKAPDLLRSVVERGHEVGCHSNEHRLVTSLGRDEFARDSRDAKKLLEDVAGMAVLGYRAPEFSVGSLSHFCFEVLSELGFEYDSSVYPVRGPRYGVRGAPRRPFMLATRAGTLVELPLLSLRVLGCSLPAAGGTYYRLLPGRILARAVRAAQEEEDSAVLYFHPYEFSTGALWLAGDGLLNLRALRHIVLHNVATPRVEARLRLVLRSFRFGRLATVARAARRRQATPFVSPEEDSHDHHR